MNISYKILALVLPERVAEIVFGQAVPVERRRIEIPDAVVPGEIHHRLGLRPRAGRAVAAQRRAALAEHGDLELGAADRPALELAHPVFTGKLTLTIAVQYEKVCIK